MSKSSHSQIIADEKKIIIELQKNSKASIDKIAKNCGCSRQKVWRIIKRLEDNKTIWGYQAIIDDEKIGVKRYQILIKKTPTPISERMMNALLEKGMTEKLAQHGVRFDCSFYTQGYFDWSLCITAPNIMVVKKFLEILNANFGEHISEIQVLEIVFPLLKSGFQNPNTREIMDFFLSK